jgi:UDP-N-acetylmuramate dehydrogenase
MAAINIPPSLGFYEQHSLVLINRGGAVFKEVIELLKDIQDEVLELYGINLEIEPEIVGS